MKSIKELIKETMNEKRYKWIVTYNFSDTETGCSFKKLLEVLKLEKQKDQSTFARKFESNVETICDFIKKIKEWSKDKKYEENDFVNIYYHTTNHIKLYVIDYDSKKKEIIFHNMEDTKFS